MRDVIMARQTRFVELRHLRPKPRGGKGPRRCGALATAAGCISSNLRWIKVASPVAAQSSASHSKGSRMFKPVFAASAAALAVLASFGAATPALAKAGDVLVRVRAIGVLPNESSGPVLPTFPGATVGVGNSFMPEIDFTYMATDNLGLELIVATTRHGLSGQGTLSGLDDLGRTWVLPPTLTLQYHFAPAAKVRPYVGAGLNYTIFYGDKTSDALNTAIGKTDLNLSNSFGWAAQAGVDFDVSEKLFVNFDIKYIDMNTKATLTTGTLVNRVDVKINPIVVGIGLGMRF
jgi:outer membrane protein